MTGVLVRINQDRDVCADSTVGRCRNVTFYRPKSEALRRNHRSQHTFDFGFLTQSCEKTSFDVLAPPCVALCHVALGNWLLFGLLCACVSLRRNSEPSLVIPASLVLGIQRRYSPAFFAGVIFAPFPLTTRQRYNRLNK